MALFDFLRRNKQNKEKSIEEMSFEELNLKINSAKEEEEILLIDAKREIKINLDNY